MVEKRVFDTLIASYMRSENSIRIIALIDNEGLPISFAIKSRKYKIKPNTLGSLIKQAYYPAENYAKAIELGEPLVQFYLFEEGDLIVINLGIGLLGILFDSSGWPLNTFELEQLISNLKIQLEKTSNQEGGLLSKITGDEKDKSTEAISSAQIEKINSILESLEKGNMDPLLTMEPAPAEETFMKIGTEYDAFMVDENKTILSMNPNYGPEFVSSTIEFLDVIKTLDQLKSGATLCSLTYYGDNKCIITGVLGAYNDQNIYMIKLYNDWEQGFKTLISPYYSIANYLVADFASEESMNFIEIIIYLTDSVDSLKDRINAYVEDEDLDIAKKFIERAAVLSIRNKNYIEAGDLYKWMGYLLHNDGETKKAIKFYEKAAEAHQMGNSFENSGADYKDMAAILYNESKITDALEYYIKAEAELQKANNEELLEQVRNEKASIIQPYLEKISEFIQNSNSETITLSYIGEKFKLSDSIIANILNQLIANGQIGGQVDLGRNRYTKMVVSTTSKTTTKTSETSSRIKGSAVLKFDRSQVSTELVKLDGKMEEMEKTFEKINLPFVEYLEYEDLLNQKQFLDHKMRIVENQDAMINQNGENFICPICFKEMNTSESLGSCSNGHKYHQSCLSIWIKTQDACPFCDNPLFPTILKTTFINTQNSTGNESENQELINELQSQISSLTSQVEHLEKVNSALKQEKGDNKDYIDKVIKERELKEKLEKELKRKELNIRELKSMIKLFKL